MRTRDGRTVGWAGALGAMLTVAGAISLAPGATYTLTDLGPINPNVSVPGGPRAINASGTLAGWNDDTNSTDRGYVWSAGASYPLESASPSVTKADGINAAGTVAGSWTPAAAQASAAIWTDVTADGIADSAGFVDLGALPNGDDAIAHDVNSSGHAVGYSNFASGGGNDHAFLHVGTQIIDLSTLGGLDSGAWGINDAGVVVGRADLPSATGHPFAWKDDNANNASDPGEMRDLLEASPTADGIARDINEAGDTVGMVIVGGQAAPVLWPADGAGIPDKDAAVVLPAAGSPFAEALGVNDAGLIVGWFFGASSPRAMLHDRGTGLTVDLNDNGLVVGAPDWTLWQAVDVNDAGLIVGWGQRNGEDRGFLLTPAGTDDREVPEPLTGVLFALACGAAGARLLRRRA